jgi:8-oxo-dGTP pyrophosphatase MutT (NUDIX family)
MNMQKRAAVLVIENEKVLLMRRRKKGLEYFAVPGGHVETGESPEIAAKRELKEETNLDVIIGKCLFDEKIGQMHEYFFLAESFAGKVSLGGPELERNSSENLYALEWVSLDEIEKVNLLPKEIKTILMVINKK